MIAHLLLRIRKFYHMVYPFSSLFLKKTRLFAIICKEVRMTPFQIIRSKRKTLCIEVLRDGSVLVRAPFFLSDRAIQTFVKEKEGWIRRQQNKVKDPPPPEVIPKKDCEILRARAKEIIPERVRFWTEKTGLAYSSIKITSAKRRFGSCNSRNSLCFSLFLARFPIALIDYVVVHELCHTRFHNHSDSFYRLVESILPDFKDREAALKALPIPQVESNSK